MNKLDCTIPELVNILVMMEETLKSSRGTVLTVEQTSSKRKSIGKKKAKSAKKQKKKNRPKNEVPKKIEAKGSVSIVMLKATRGETVHFIWRA